MVEKILTTENDALLCPKCGGDRLTRIKIEIFEENQSYQTTISGGKVEISSRGTSFPIGVHIYFRCSFCPTFSKLYIGQYKGQAFPKFSRLGKKEEEELKKFLEQRKK